MYPLDQGRWGPTVRISHLRDELSALVDLDVVDGYRGRRRGALLRYAFSGRLRGLSGIYVESSSFLPAELDIAFLALARLLGIPVITYVRDAYQLFDDYGSPDGLRGRIGRWLFLPAMRALGSVSSRLAFPTRGLADAVLGGRSADAFLSPPGSPAPFDIARDPSANRLLFVGDARLPAQGAARLVSAIEVARGRGVDVSLVVVCRPGQEPPAPYPEWLEVKRAEGAEIAALLPGVLATVIPRPRNAYNDLALPIKLFDYLAYGRPLLVTDCTAQAAVVRAADAGQVVGDDVEALADGIATVASGDVETLDRWSRHATSAAQRQSWAWRAGKIVNELGRLRG
jgi:glycosyltransferase involved in cell wall biosynthesis